MMMMMMMKVNTDQVQILPDLNPITYSMWKPLEYRQWLK